jgi:hypothetical protein
MILSNLITQITLLMLNHRDAFGANAKLDVTPLKLLQKW